MTYQLFILYEKLNIFETWGKEISDQISKYESERDIAIKHLDTLGTKKELITAKIIELRKDIDQISPLGNTEGNPEVLPNGKEN